LGGIARATAEAILLCEAAGYGLVMVETVGVGQSEYTVADLCDVFALLVAPSGGDEIQAIKKGIVELANVIVVTKNDGDLVKYARKMAAEFISATKFINIGTKPRVRRISAHSGEGLTELWDIIKSLSSDREVKLEKRRQKRVNLLRSYLVEAILNRLQDQYNLEAFEQRLLVDDSLLLWDVVDEILTKSKDQTIV
jgi:LAO/AO transport system kinase